MDFMDFSQNVQQILFVLAAIVVGYLVGRLVKWAAFKAIRWYGKKSESVFLGSLYRHLSRPASYVIPILFAIIFLPFSYQIANLLSLFLPITKAAADIDVARIANARLILEILLYSFGAWLLIEFTSVFADVIRKRYDVESTDNLTERKIITQLAFIKRLVAVIVTILAIAFILFQFDGVRELGTGLLTSAGVAGIIIGFAAQKSIANLLAGFQIAFTQPIRIDDAVIVENEFGRVEEITLTYVVVRVWDQRRLVVPLNYFLDHPFQNWTRTTSELLGTVFIYTDYRMPVQALREELTTILENTDLWDQRVNNIMVTDANERTIQLRVLLSARNAGQAFDLRCLVREKLITFIQNNYPHCLPRTRIEMAPVEEHQNGQTKTIEPFQQEHN